MSDNAEYGASLAKPTTGIEPPDIVEIAEAGREWAGAPDGD